MDQWGPLWRAQWRRGWDSNAGDKPLFFPARPRTPAADAVPGRRTGAVGPSPRRLAGTDPKNAHWIKLLRIHDALDAGASQHEIADCLFDKEWVASGWDGHSDFMRSRLRRMIAQQRRLIDGGYRRLLRSGTRRSKISGATTPFKSETTVSRGSIAATRRGRPRGGVASTESVASSIDRSSSPG